MKHTSANTYQKITRLLCARAESWTGAARGGAANQCPLSGVKRTWPKGLSDARAAAEAIGLQFIRLDVRNVRDIELAVATFVERGADILQFGSGVFFNSHRERIVALMARYRLPAIYNWRELVVAGGLMSSAPNLRLYALRTSPFGMDKQYYNCGGC